MTPGTVISVTSLGCSALLVVGVLLGATGMVPLLQAGPEAVLAALVIGVLSGNEALGALQENK